MVGKLPNVIGIPNKGVSQPHSLEIVHNLIAWRLSGAPQWIGFRPVSHKGVLRLANQAIEYPLHESGTKSFGQRFTSHGIAMGTSTAESH